MILKTLIAIIAALGLMVIQAQKWNVEKLKPIESVDIRILGEQVKDEVDWINFNPQRDDAKVFFSRVDRQFVEYRAHVNLSFLLDDRSAQRRSLLITQALHGLELRNHDRIKNILPLSNKYQRIKWYRPAILTVDEILPYLDEKGNLLIYSSSWDANVFIPPIYVGSQENIFWIGEVVNFFSSTLPTAAMIIVLLCAVFFFFMWRKSSQNRVYLFTAISSFSWFLVCLFNGHPAYPVEWLTPVNAIIYTFIAVSIWGAANLALAYSGSKINIKINMYLLLVYLFGPLLFLFNLIDVHQMNSVWLPGIFIFVAPFCFLFFKSFGEYNESRRDGLILFLTLVGFLFALRDVQLFGGFIDRTSISSYVTALDIASLPLYYINMYAAIFFLYSGIVAISNYGRLLTDLDSSHDVMESKLRRQELEIKALMLDRLRQERLAAAQDERLLISRDLHDGLGAKLTSILYQCRAGQVNPTSLEEDVISTLRDLRQIINNKIENDCENFFSMVFELCVQFEELLSNQSRIFSYTIPDEIEFSLMNNAGSHVLFIIQELLVNFLKHSVASRLNLSIVFDGALRLEIVEYEFSAQDVVIQYSDLKFSGGNGMKNIESRANEIGAVFSVSASREQRVSILYFPMLNSDLARTYQANP